MTTVIPNTFLGPNQGNAEGYIPLTIIESAKIDADLNQILTDLDNQLSLLQTIVTKLDGIDEHATNDQTVEEIVAAINNSTLTIDADNQADSTTAAVLNAAIATHKSTVVANDMHPETSIKSTGLTYSNTPTTLITTCTNLLDELKNIRYQVNRLNGQTNWSDTPSASISSLTTSINNLNTDLRAHLGNLVYHLTANTHDAIFNANSPSGANTFITHNDVNGLGIGDMTKAIYDINNDGVVDKTAGIVSGTTVKTYNDIVSKIASDISVHRAISSAHHARYTDAEAIGAINNDDDHSSTASHCYCDLTNKPPANAFTTTEVTNLRTAKLDDGTTPWVGAIHYDKYGLVPADKLPIEYVNSNWRESSVNTSSKAYFSSTTAGVVASTFTGPCMIYSGIGVVTSTYGYLQYSVNGGSTWYDCVVSPTMAKAPFSTSVDMSMWSCTAMYIPVGSTYRIRAGSTCGCSQVTTGAGYHIRYKHYS